jgi:hypothetical protein
MAKTPTKSDEAEKPDDVDVKEETVKQPEPTPRADAIPIEPNPVEANEPYPTGSPPDPAEEFRRIHGYDRPPEEAPETPQPPAEE